MGRAAPLVLGVTVLTSMDDQGLSEVGFQGSAASQVERLAALAVHAGLPGLVCSPGKSPDCGKSFPARCSWSPPASAPQPTRRTIKSGR